MHRNTVADMIEIATSTACAMTLEQSLLLRLRRDVGFDIGFFVRANRVGPGQQGLSVPLVAETSAWMNVYGKELAPVFARAQRERGVAIDRDTLGHVFEHTRLYREFVAPHGGRCTALAVLTRAGQPIATLSLGRCGRSSFSPRDLDTLAKLVPTLSLCELALRDAPDALDRGLSTREAEVIGYLQRGLTNREIAQACGTSPNTVRNQLRNAFDKLGATTRAEAVAISLGRL